MKLKLIYLVAVLVLFNIPICFAQEDVLAKLTPEAINARISEIRMGDIIVKTTPGADVKIQQVRHEFLFGTAISNKLAEMNEDAMSDEDRQMFLKVLAENFNYAVHEDALKWYSCEKEYNVVDYTEAERIWELCNELNIPMRGHCIFWAKDKYIMPWLWEMNSDELRGAVIRRAKDVTSHFKGRINEFDLNNEMIHGDFFRRRLGYGIINEMAWAAKAGNPDAVLYVNDYGVLDVGLNDDAYMTQIENLLANGVPIGGIGCQAHRAHDFETITPDWHIQRTLDKLAKFNLPIKITECLFEYHDDETTVQELNKILPIYFAHPAVEAILMWGFWEGAHWKPHAAMWEKDWTPTPQAQAYRDLVFNRWWTRVSGKADDKGSFKAHAFYGDYIITSNGETREVTLSKKDKSVMVVFK